MPSPSTPRRSGARVCAEPGCDTRLSAYNDGDHCALHRAAEVLRTRGRHIA